MAQKQLDVIYLAGGSGKRTRLGYPKQYIRLRGIPAMVYGAKLLDQHDAIRKIIIVAQEQEWDHVWDLMIDNKITNIEFAEGQATRQGSCYAGLKQTETDHVLVCEAVRPFMSRRLLDKVIEQEGDFVVPIVHPKATVISYTGKVYDRDLIGEVQMPQKYSRKLLLDAHSKAYSEYTDDAAMVIGETDNGPVVIEGEEQNIKITTPLDVKIAEAIIDGMGID